MDRELPDEVLRGQMYYADLDPVIGSEQGGNRPVLVIQNNVGNRHSPTIIIAPHHDQGEEGPSADPYRYPSILWPTSKLYGYAGADQND